MPPDMHWRIRDKLNAQEYHEKASFFHLAEFENVFLFSFFEKMTTSYAACYVIYS